MYLRKCTNSKVTVELRNSTLIRTNLHDYVFCDVFVSVCRWTGSLSFGFTEIRPGVVSGARGNVQVKSTYDYSATLSNCEIRTLMRFKLHNYVFFNVFALVCRLDRCLSLWTRQNPSHQSTRKCCLTPSRKRTTSRFRR